MNHKITLAIETNPALGWLGSVGSIMLGWLTWLLNHLGDFAQFFAVIAGVFGMVAGYYTMRIQRRVWRKRNDE